MSEHLMWCKSLQGGTAIDCNCKQQREIIWERFDTEGAMGFMDDKLRSLESDNARLRKAIEDANFHSHLCLTQFESGGLCDCGFYEWKRNALEGE